MKLEDIKNVAVIGAGVTGHGIAQVCAIAGLNVHMRSRTAQTLEKATRQIGQSLDKLHRKKRLPKGEDPESVFSRIHPTQDLGVAIKAADVVIESVPEVLEIKKEVLGFIESGAAEHAVFATNTSNKSISGLASFTDRPERFLGTHFFNPVAQMKAVEIIRGDLTNDETYHLMTEFSKKLNKIPIRVLKDSPGFIANRLIVTFQALMGLIVENNIATPNQVDAMTRKSGAAMGPFEMLDFIGLDVVVNTWDHFGVALGPDYETPLWLKGIVETGNLGKKTGKGIFDWPSERADIDLDDTTEELSVADMKAVQVNEGMKLHEEGVIQDFNDIDLVMKYGTGSRGVMSLLKRVGREKLIEICERWCKEFNVEIFKPTETLRNAAID